MNILTQTFPLSIRNPQIEDSEKFIKAMQASTNLHHPWVYPPTTSEAYIKYIERYTKENQKSFLICSNSNEIAGVININEIVHGSFQNGYLGFYVVSAYAGMGVMQQGLKLVIKTAFNDMNLHRLEANIQPHNVKSIRLVSKLGFRNEGYSPKYLKINNDWCDHERWAITIEDFFNTK